MRLTQLQALTERHRILKGLLYPAILLRRRLLRRHRIQQERFFDDLYAALADDPIVRVPHFPGVFAVDCRSDLFKRLVFDREYEPDLGKRCLELVDTKRDVIDIGANVGFFTVLFASRLINRRVLAVEPATKALARLHANLRRNDVHQSTIVFEGVASNHIGETTLRTVEGKEEYSSLGAMIHPAIAGEATTSQRVVATTVDALVQQYALDPGFMKVDAEGAEYTVFDGARGVLEKHRPIILSELYDYLLQQNGSSSAAVIELVREYDYEVVDALSPETPAGARDPADILCIPRESAHVVAGRTTAREH